VGEHHDVTVAHKFVTKRRICKMKAKVAFLLLGVLVCLLPPVANAASTLSGSFNITGYKEPGLTGPYTWCFDFTKTGTVLFPNSGTWNVPSYSYGWFGTWYQTGDEIILHGVADGTFIFSWKGRLLTGGKIGGRQVEFYIDGSTDTAGTFYGTKISGSCSAAAAAPAKKDPAR
jgi:hypothetical protein